MPGLGTLQIPECIGHRYKKVRRPLFSCTSKQDTDRHVCRSTLKSQCHACVGLDRYNESRAGNPVSAPTLFGFRLSALSAYAFLQPRRSLQSCFFCHIFRSWKTTSQRRRCQMSKEDLAELKGTSSSAQANSRCSFRQVGSPPTVGRSKRFKSFLKVLIHLMQRPVRNEEELPPTQATIRLHPQ